MKSQSLCLLGLVACASPAFAINIAGNAGFETAGPTMTDSAQWQATGGGPVGTFSQRDSSNPFAGNWDHNLVAVGNAVAGASAGIVQNSIADAGFASLAPGSTVSLSFEGRYNLGPGGVGFYALRILDSGGNIVADTGLQTISSSTNGYFLFSSQALTVPAFGASPADAYAAFIEFDVAAGAFDGSFAQAYIDNVNVEATLVPAPATLALLGGSLLLGTRRRR
ncbi:MAG: hypothetical protein WC718_04520 [Phycisphaerales bacterium]|jgi:hypothetical protein